MWFPRDTNSSIHGLQTRGYEIVSYHRIRVPWSNLLCYLLLFSIPCPDQDLEIITNHLKVIEHPMIKLKKREGKMGIFSFGTNLKKGEERWSMSGVG